MLLNTVVYCEDNKIKIKIEKVDKIDNQYPEKIENIEVSIKSFQPIDFQGVVKTEEHTEYKRKYPIFTDEDMVGRHLDRMNFKAKEIVFPHRHNKSEPEPEEDYYREAIIYELPTELHSAIHLIMILDSFARHQCSSAAIGNNQSIDDRCKDGRLNTGVFNFFDCRFVADFASLNHKFDGEHRFLKNVLKLNPIPQEYQQIIGVLKEIYGYALNNCMMSKEYRKNNLIDNIIVFNFILTKGFSPYCLLEPRISEQEKRTFISDLQTAFIQANKKEELSSIFIDLNKIALMRLYEPCLEKIDLNGYPYDWEFTEWDFLKHAKWSIRPDGRMSIIELHQNEGYLDSYAQGKKNHAKFEHEMRHLGAIIGLEFAEDCDFHKELIVTEQCTQTLKQKGLHYNQQYLDKLIAKETLVPYSNSFFSLPQHSKQVAMQSHASIFERCVIS